MSAEKKVSLAAYHAMLGLESFVSKSSKLEASLLALIKMRASQINGCAFYIDMHSKDARVNGETEQRLYALEARLAGLVPGRYFTNHLKTFIP